MGGRYNPNTHTTQEAGSTTRRRRQVALLTSVVMTVSGCSMFRDDRPDNTASALPKQPSILVVPDFTHLRDDGKLCEGGAPRPCAQPIYRQPQLTRPLTTKVIMNQLTADRKDIAGPNEAYNGDPGDPLTVVCQVQGETLTNRVGQSTAVWNVVKLPANAINATTLRDAQSGHVEFGVQKDENNQVTFVYGFTPSLWTEQPGVRPELNHCTDAQNPSHYPAAS